MNEREREREMKIEGKKESEMEREEGEMESEGKRVMERENVRTTDHREYFENYFLRIFRFFPLDFCIQL